MCSYKNDVSLGDFYNRTTARGMILSHIKAIRACTALLIRIYHKNCINIRVKTAVGTPVEDVDSTDWSRENPVMMVVGTSNVSYYCIIYQGVVQTRRIF